MRGKVRVGLNGDVYIGEDLVVVGPSRVGEVDCLILRAGKELREEEGSEMEGTCAGDGLQSCDLQICEVDELRMNEASW